MTLNDLLNKHLIDPEQVVVMRHRPKEPEVRKVLPWLVHEQPGWIRSDLPGSAWLAARTGKAFRPAA